MELNIKTFLYIFLHLCPLILVCFFTISSIIDNDLKGMVYLVGLIFSIAVIIFGGNLTSYLPEWLMLHENPNNDTLCKVLSFGTGELSNLSIGQMIIGFSFFYLLTTMLLGEDNLVSSNWPTITFFSLLMSAELLVNTNINNMWSNVWSNNKKLLISVLVAVVGIVMLCVHYWEYILDNLLIISTVFIILGIQAKQYFNINDLNPKNNDNVSIPEPNNSSYCYNLSTSLFTYGLAGGLGAAYASIISAFNTPELQYFPKYKNNEKCEKVGKKTFACKVFKTGSHVPDAIRSTSIMEDHEKSDLH